MEIFKPKIVIIKKNKYLKISKEVDSFKIGISIILFFILMIILKYVKPIINQYNICSLNFLLSWAIVTLLFIIYCLSIINFLSNEILELDNEKIIIKKFFLNWCYYDKEILLKRVLKITYQNYRLLIVLNIYNNESNNIIIQANTGLEEDEEFFFGVGINLKLYGEFQKSLKEILEDKIKNVEFIYYE